jgi:hypothetical protein
VVENFGSGSAALYKIRGARCVLVNVPKVESGKFLALGVLMVVVCPCCPAL